MSKIETGGPAFPGKVCVGHTLSEEAPIYEHPSGMTLRDYFAAAAMQGYLSGFFSEQAGDADKCATWAYEQADAMLKARGQ